MFNTPVPFPRLMAGLLGLCLALALSTRLQASELANSVISNSALGVVIDQYPKMMTEGISQGLSQTGQLNPIVKAGISGMMTQAFDSTRMRRQVAQDLDQGMSQQALARVNDWYQSPLGEKVAALEARAAMPAAWRVIEEQGSALVSRYQGSERARLFSDFDRASRATESAVDTAVAIQVGFATAMAAFNGAVVDTEVVRQRVESQRTMLRGMVEQQVYAGYLYTYEQLSNEELREYIRFMKTEAGDRFNRVATESVQQAILEPIDAIAVGLARLLGPASR
ncbi:MAG: DUF2059 domain-containing protein [Marinobacter sp.]|uniref:DUF2059 domain-containing protein n=1 Tax=Marinobacter sp. TaxID=50741 RepID=UPI00299DDB0D|nr:DUF2059 domain-containing protein [Marinobacter sp.]MDX1635925.1 DUF2059 domain-containing protein [Marinobacter sp.]